MRAVLMERGNLWVADQPDPTPGPGEVLVKSMACGICGSDLHAAQHTDEFVQTSRDAGGAFKLTTFDPVVLGHEFCAEIVEHGSETSRELAAGTLVCSVPMLLRPKHLAVGYSDEVPGGFAEYMLLSERLLMPVPEGTPATAAALTEPLAVGLHAVNKARLDGGETCLVLGCGPVGLAVITALNARGAGPIIASDFSPGRRELALRQGAHEAYDPRETDPFQTAAARKADDVVVFEAVGVPGMLDSIFLGAPQNARIVVVGVCLQTDHARPLIAINKELNVQYVLGYDMNEFAKSLRNIADGRFDVADLVTARVPLEDVAGAFERLRSPDEHGKIIVEPWQPGGAN